MIIYFDNGNNHFRQYFNECGHPIVTPYNKRIKVKIINKLEKNAALRDFLYNKKEIKPAQNETIIVFDSNVSRYFLEWLRKRFQSNRIIFWYWNPVLSKTTTIHPNQIPIGIEKWSYSPADCAKYNLTYNTTFYFDCIYKPVAHKPNDNLIAFFIGRDKNRLNLIEKTKKILEKCGVDCDFRIIGNKRCAVSNKGMAYDDIVELVNKSDVLIDLYLDHSAGLSLRMMESIFFNKKIITNNFSVKKYDFYNSNNIFVFDSIDNIKLDELKLFLKHEYIEIDKKIVNTYLFSKWLERFDN